MSSCYTYIKLERSRHSIYSLVFALCPNRRYRTSSLACLHITRTPLKLLDTFIQIIGDTRREKLIFSALALGHCNTCGLIKKQNISVLQEELDKENLAVFIQVTRPKKPEQRKHKTFHVTLGSLLKPRKGLVSNLTCLLADMDTSSFFYFTKPWEAPETWSTL